MTNEECRFGPLNFPTLSSAFRACLEQAQTAPDCWSAAGGRICRELLGLAIRIDNPRNRLCYVPARRANPAFQWAEFLWFVSGRDDLELISYYAPRFRSYSKDGISIPGSAYGPRLFRFGPTDVNQWANILAHITNDEGTKRAVIQVYDPVEAMDIYSPDIACLTTLAFLLRDGRLHLSAFMRANDAYRGFVNNLFCFTLVQELMARDLGVEMGSYSHYVGTFHIYETDQVRVGEVLADPTVEPLFAENELLTMPGTGNWDSIEAVMEIEHRLRVGGPGLNMVEAAGFDPFWRQPLLMFEILRRVAASETIDDWLFRETHPTYRPLVNALWSRAH